MLCILAGTSALRWAQELPYFFLLQLSLVHSVRIGTRMKSVSLTIYIPPGGLLAAAIANMNGVGGKPSKSSQAMHTVVRK